MNEHFEDTIILTDSNGCDMEFTLEGTVNYEGEEYAVLLPFELEADEYVILKKSAEGFVGIASQELLDAVFDKFLSIQGNE